MSSLGIREVHYDGYLISYLVGYETEFTSGLCAIINESTWRGLRDCAREHLYDHGYWSYDEGDEWEDKYDAYLWQLKPVLPDREELVLLECDFTREVLPKVNREDEYATAFEWFEAISAQTPEPQVPEQEQLL